jgi:hypothetical protein
LGMPAAGFALQASPLVGIGRAAITSTIGP